LPTRKIPIGKGGLGISYRQILSPDKRFWQVPPQAQHLEHIIVQAGVEDPVLVANRMKIVVLDWWYSTFRDLPAVVDLKCRQLRRSGRFIVA
jgi:hypothetical protein